jgi:tetrahydromethanopterin S-methyltransferase subunit G
MPRKPFSSVPAEIARALLGAFPVAGGPEIIDLLLKVKRSQQDVDTQVSEAIVAIHKTSTLVADLETSLKEKAVQLEHLRQEHDRYSQLTEIEAKRAQALLTQIEATVGRRAGRERWISFGINIVAGLILFVFGIFLSDPFKHLWNLVVRHAA